MKSKVFRIYIEDVTEQAEAVEMLVNSRLNCFTVYRAVGCWQGKQEQSLIIEVISDIAMYFTVKALARELKTLLRQEAVLVTEQEIDAELI
jgi:hypothetical protein